MQIQNVSIRRSLIACLVAAPLLQLIGDCLWVSHKFPFFWNVWRQASYIFFIPVGFLLAKQIEFKSGFWAILACSFFVVGCFGSATMMPLFRLGAFYPVEGHNAFPAIVESVIAKKGFAFTIYPLGLCFPIGFLLFGTAFLRLHILPRLFGLAFVASGILYWMGNAVKVDALLIGGDVWLLLLFSSLAYLFFRSRPG
jgi:hypothetical protein